MVSNAVAFSMTSIIISNMNSGNSQVFFCSGCCCCCCVCGVGGCSCCSKLRLRDLLSSVWASPAVAVASLVAAAAAAVVLVAASLSLLLFLSSITAVGGGGGGGGGGNGAVSSFWRTKGSTPNSSPAMSIGRRQSPSVNLNLRREVSESLSTSTHSTSERASRTSTTDYSGRANRSISGGNSGRANRTTSGGGIGAALLLAPQHPDAQRSRSVPSTSADDYAQRQHPAVIKRSTSSMSQNSNKKKSVTKARAQARRMKYDQMQGLDIGHEIVSDIDEDQNDDHYEPLRQEALSTSIDHSDHSASMIFGNIARPTADSNIRHSSIGTDTSGGMSSQTSNSASIDSTIIHSRMDGSIGGGNNNNNNQTSSYRNERSMGGSTTGNTTSGGSSVLFGKSSSLIFPTGVDPPVDVQDRAYNHKRHKINTLLDACDCMRFPFKKKLILSNLDLTAADIPVKDLHNTSLGNSLHKLALSGNPLTTVPPKLVTCLPVLKNLDLSQCGLHQIPDQWNLPQLRQLNLSHNRLTDFPEETMLEGLPELQQLNMYGNKVSDIIVPQNPKLLAKLELLNLGYNDLSYLPEDLDSLKSLRTLKVMNNLLELIPMRVCDMELKSIDVSSNPVVQPPIETCERGIASMKRYYHCLRMEDKSKAKLRDIQQRSAKKQGKAKRGFGIGSLPKLRKSPPASGFAKKTPDDGSSVAQSQATSSTKISAQQQFDSFGPPKVVKTPRSGSEGIIQHEVTPKEVTRSISLDQAALDKERATSIGEVSFALEHSSMEFGGSSLNLQDEITVNDTLKVIFVGMAMVGKTSMIKRFIEGEDAVIPKRDDRTVGVDIYEWDPKNDKRYEHIDTRIAFGDQELQQQMGDTNVKFSVWDFAGQHVYHATHQLFFSQRALYVLVWDMGATNDATKQRKTQRDADKGTFSLSYDSDEDSEEDDDGLFSAEEEVRRADRALERDIDEKVQFWVDCIQSSAPGAAILPVASFDDYFDADGGQEANRRCEIMKQRLLKHEEKRIQGIKDRLKKYVDSNRAHEEGAQRLRKLLSSYTRPKLIFGNDGPNSVLRVSGTKYTGFENLTQRVIDIATGRDKCNMRYPIFRGHVGARIPHMRLEVRDAVRQMRDRFKVVEWGYFLNQLRQQGLTNAEDISDALHFLANIGELSYFGTILPDGQYQIGEDAGHALRRASYNSINLVAENVDLSDEDDDDDDEPLLSIDDTTLTTTLPSTEDASMTTAADSVVGGLSQFVFLNPRWLVAAVACILRHDLDQEIHETKRVLNNQQKVVNRSDSFYEANLNCPVITADDACMLWQAKKFTKKAAERASEYSNNMTLKPFEFLQLLLIRFGVFVPIDLGIDKAFLGGKEYSFSHLSHGNDDTPAEITVSQPNNDLKARYLFLPSLLGPGEPAEAWTFKSTDSWKATLCHSVLFPDGVPPGLMERITASVLSNIYSISTLSQMRGPRTASPIGAGRLVVKEVLCWRTAFLVKLGLQTVSTSSDGADRVGESVVEVFCGLVDRESHLCVGADYMSVGSQRLIVSAKGQEGNGGHKIWNGGYLLVVKAVQRVMEEYGGLEFERQGFCPDCLAKKAIHEARYWDLTVVRAAVKNGDSTIRCRHGHRVDIRLVAGPLDVPAIPRPPASALDGSSSDLKFPINHLLRATVVVALWDGKTRQVVRCGSGFIADKKRGLIVTASHTLMNIWGDKSTPFGEDYDGLRGGKALIGVITKSKSEESSTEAVFRYFAKIVSKDPNIEKGVCHLDACVLRITTRMERDVSTRIEECAELPERLLLGNTHAMKQEGLAQLKLTNRCELDEQVRIFGYNQGGEGVFGPGETLNRYVDFARGYVCKKFAAGEGNDSVRHRFKPREEIVVLCPTIGGHSGGPCVNQQGEVIGILSRADPAENQRCYLVPTYEWKALLKEAKRKG
mmetsp:Transcript_36160/g.87460  ORF Transcript_36160/g.87460 Transcript_36160/m.87460 type:complete len:1913 (-) Transcript_36160:67-5805(-)